MTQVITENATFVAEFCSFVRKDILQYGITPQAYEFVLRFLGVDQKGLPFSMKDLRENTRPSGLSSFLELLDNTEKNVGKVVARLNRNKKKKS